MPLFGLDELADAAAIVRRVVPPTPAYAWPLLAKAIGAEVIVKHENHTPERFELAAVGPCSTRCAAPGPRRTGPRPHARNHGQSIALAAARHGLPLVIVVPEGNSAEKNAAMAAFGGAEVVTAGKDFDDSRDTVEQL